MLRVDYKTLTPDNIPTPTTKQELLALLRATNSVLDDINHQLTEWGVILEAACKK